MNDPRHREGHVPRLRLSIVAGVAGAPSSPPFPRPYVLEGAGGADLQGPGAGDRGRADRGADARVLPADRHANRGALPPLPAARSG